MAVACSSSGSFPVTDGENGAPNLMNYKCKHKIIAQREVEAPHDWPLLARPSNPFAPSDRTSNANKSGGSGREWVVLVATGEPATDQSSFYLYL